MRILILLLISTGLAIGCRGPSNNIDAVRPPDTIQYQSNPSVDIGHDIEVKADKGKKPEKKTCNFTDGMHAATVDYYNPKTEHTAKYDLQVQVKDCKIVQLNFPNGGWLDEDHIQPTDLNEEGGANLKDDKGRIWKVHMH
jgi:major membrane immunogen (membrane-anchored lipoprotein)